ncbi:hypothetical protein E6Q11_04050 [Candidatus Dojkabacteria bacterium]|uniref:Uncharacterized protein n=1 Tax=Candidatus Dojkabacteria bacterium TaxID=2099670 RepID=A0A5C7J5Z8_9BACT|nr:MAG: hypothetical protein E6Q11_04050 [Candidatus Dojkabacteria bacterium]
MQEDELVISVLNEINRLVQKLKSGGKAVDSTVTTTTKLVENTVVHETVLTITGDLKHTIIDKRTPEEVKQAAIEEKSKVQAMLNQQMAKADEIISVVDVAKTK